MVRDFKSIVPTVQGTPAKQRGEEMKAARMIAEQLSRNKHDADQNLRQGGDFGPEDADWQTRRRAVFDSNLCRQLDVLQPETAMPRDDVIELLAKGYWEKQEEMGVTDGRGYDDKSRIRMCETHTTNDFWAWRAVKLGFPEWPMGVVLVQEANDDCNFQEVAELIQMLAKVAEIIFRTPTGIMRYLMGASLYHDTEMAVGSEPICPGVTRADFFPSMFLQYMPRVLGLYDVDLCGPEARSLIITAASHNRKLAAWIAQLSEKGRNFVKKSLKNLGIRTALQPPRLTKQEEREETTSIYRTRSCSVEGILVSAIIRSLVDQSWGRHRPSSSPPTETKSPAWGKWIRRWDLNRRTQEPSPGSSYEGMGHRHQDLLCQRPWRASVPHLRPTYDRPHLHLRPRSNKRSG
jgi:hypothetical protein